MDSIDVILLSNAGVMLSYQGKKFLLDALHDGCGGNFNKISTKILAEMNAGLGKFSNVDYLLFSHMHSDHFKPKMLMDYLENNVVKKLFFPLSRGTAEIKGFALSKNCPCTRLELPVNKAYVYCAEEDIAITAFNCMHEGIQFTNMPNYCYILSLGGQNILFTADAAMIPEYFEYIVKELHIHTAFVNPLFYITVEGRHILDTIIKPDKLVVYHLPFIKDGKEKMLGIIKRNMIKYIRDYSVTAFYKKNQAIQLN